MKVDDALNMQLKAFAEQLKRATGADHAVVMVGDDHASVCGIASEYANMSAQEQRDTQGGVMYMMLQTTNIVVGQMTGGRLRIQIVGPEGPIEMASVNLHSFAVELG